MRAEEIAVDFLAVLDPFGAENFKGTCFIWVIFCEVADNSLAHLFGAQFALENVLVFMFQLFLRVLTPFVSKMNVLNCTFVS